MSHEVKIGRDYRIDCLDTADWLMGAETVLTAAPTPQEKVANIEGFVDYVTEDIKGNFHLPFERISDPLITPPSERYAGRFGLVDLQQVTTMFDYVKGPSRDILIARGTPVLDLRIPIVDFPPKNKEVVPASMITRSLALSANYVIATGLKQPYVAGLTHPRLGNLAAKRWGFAVEEHPFPNEIYELIDVSLKDAESRDAESWKLQNLKAVRDQVLVYQTREEFIKKANIQDRVIYEAQKPSSEVQAKPEFVTWNKRATHIPLEERTRVTQILQFMREGLEKTGVLDNVLRIEVYQPNNDGENPCLVLLKRASIDSLKPGNGPSLIESIHSLERQTWQQFRPLPWRFALLIEGSKPVTQLSEEFFGTKRIPKPLAVASGAQSN